MTSHPLCRASPRTWQAELNVVSSAHSQCHSLKAKWAEELQLSVALPDIPSLVRRVPRSSPSKQLIRLDQNSTSPTSLLFLVSRKEKYRRSRDGERQNGEEWYGRSRNGKNRGMRKNRKGWRKIEWKGMGRGRRGRSRMGNMRSVAIPFPPNLGPKVPLTP